MLQVFTSILLLLTFLLGAALHWLLSPWLAAWGSVVDIDRPQGPRDRGSIFPVGRIQFLNYPLRPLLCCGVVSPGFSLGCRVSGITQVAQSTCRIPSTGYGPSASALRFRLVPSRYRYSRLSRVSLCRVPASPSLCFRSLFGGTNE